MLIVRGTCTKKSLQLLYEGARTNLALPDHEHLPTELP